MLRLAPQGRFIEKSLHSRSRLFYIFGEAFISVVPMSYFTVFVKIEIFQIC